MRIVIIEDEELTANDLANTIKAISDEYSIVQILSSISEGLEYFSTNKDFDLIFSDIELGDGKSFEIFHQVSIDKPVVFCTAFDQFALQAFDANGIAYILKPFNLNSVEKSLIKVKSLVGNPALNTSNHGKLAEILHNEEKKGIQSILCYQRDRIIPLRNENISIAYRENDITYVLYNQKPFHVNYSLDELEHLLGEQFFRANRQIIVNRRFIKEVKQYFFRKLLVTLNFEFKEQIIVSKAKSSGFLLWLKQ